MIPFRQSCTGDLVVAAAFQPRFAVAPAVQIAAGKPLPQSVNALFKSLKPNFTPVLGKSAGIILIVFYAVLLITAYV